MTNPEHDNPATATPDADPGAAHRSRRRRQAVIGATGLAAVLGLGGVLVANRPNAETAADTPTVVAKSEQTSPSTSEPSSTPATAASPTVASSPGAEASPGAAASPGAEASPGTTDPRARKEVIAARKKAAADGVQIQHPIGARAATVADADISVTNTGNLRSSKSTMRLVSAPGDLSGRRELAWVADQGSPVGAARCSQRFRFANEAKPAVKKNLLVCWQTSARKSVYTVTVSVDGKPSKTASVAAIAKKWKQLG
jgi:hypothetical protein